MRRPNRWLERCRLTGLASLVLAAAWLHGPVARAGFTLEMDVVRANPYGYSFGPNFMTNAATSDAPYGDYYITSYGYPTNGAAATYRYDTNGLAWLGSSYWGYNDYDTLIHDLTYGPWSILFTNASLTNVYYFNVTANLVSNEVPFLEMIYPTNGEVEVPLQPTFVWSGPTNYTDLVIYSGDESAGLPVTQTDWSDWTFSPGTNSFTVHYDLYDTNSLVSSVPLEAGGNSLAGWSSTAHLQDYAVVQFVAGSVDTSGTTHTLVAHYPFDATSGDVLPAAVDTSGNGYNMSFGGGYGAEGGVDMTNDAAAGIGAVRFHDGDGISAGFLGWGAPEPAVLLSALAGSFSVSCWIKTTQNDFGSDTSAANQGAGIVCADTGMVTNDVLPLALTGDTIAFNTGGAADTTLHSTQSVNDGNYHHIVVTRTQATGQMVIYIDGVLDGFTVGSTNLLNAPQILTIGSVADAAETDPDNGNYYNGYDGELDDLQIYAGVLSAADVTNLYAHPGSTIANGGGAVDFNDTLGTTNLTWATSGDSAWFAETTNTWSGSMAAAQSGSVTNSQSSVLSTTVTGPGILTFYWASQDDCANFDYEFDIDGGYQADINCGTAWSQTGPFIISAGQHTLSWITHANGDTDPTEAGFLDAVSFTPGSAPVITVNPFSQTNYPGYSVALYAEATGNPTATWQWYTAAGATAIPYATNTLFIPTNSGSAGAAGSYYAVAGNPFGTASTLTATVTFMSAAAPSNWSAAFACEMDNSAQGPTTNYNLACVLDATGNLYTVGSINGTNTFGSNLLVSVNYQSCASVLKQAAAGTPIWGLCVSNTPTGSSYSESVALAPGNGCYVAGNFGGTNWLGTNLLLDTAGASTFLARIDAGGNLLWVRTVTGGYNFTEYHELAADAAGNVTLSALISGATSFGGTNLTVTGQQGLLAQFDANGNVRWLQVPSAWPTYLVSDGERLYGSMGGGATNYIGGVTNVSDRKRVLFCLNATNGQAQWLAPLGGGLDTGNPGGFDDDDVLVAVAGTNVFAAGSAWGSNAVFGSLSITFPAAKGQYLARYDADGVPQSATAFGSQFTWPWAVQADAEGNVYVGGDFDTYSIFGRDIIAAPFYATVQSLGSLEDRIPGQGFLAKFDRNGNPLWARLAESEGSYLNCRDLALAADGIWACGFFNQIAAFGAIDISGAITVEGTGLTTISYHPDGFMAKMVQAAAPLPVTLSSLTNAGGNFQFSFLTQSAFTHDVQYRTNLVAGTGWQTYSNVTGDGTLKTIAAPLSLFSPARQGFIRVSTQ